MFLKLWHFYIDLEAGGWGLESWEAVTGEIHASGENLRWAGPQTYFSLPFVARINYEPRLSCYSGTNPNHFLFLGESAKFGGSILTILVSTGMTELKHNPMIMLNFR